jgi:DNA polymerase sigma
LNPESFLSPLTPIPRGLESNSQQGLFYFTDFSKSSFRQAVSGTLSMEDPTTRRALSSQRKKNTHTIQAEFEHAILMVERNLNTVIDLSFHFYKDTILVEKSS